ncbi:hypothetical protein Dda_2555 [Drechslerella dactyloides]|uniref:Uncharacterized protein n=1 Tax=Drechslerella dactyloides TaxID=74499 RepID=A0AAD6J079_DREDA|nr:hypothetical protein Dda_2555 [Drechslerella dactyloides]
MAAPSEPMYSSRTTIVVDNANVQPFSLEHWGQRPVGNKLQETFVGYLPSGKPFRALVGASGPCSVVNNRWWYENVHGRTFPWIGKQNITIKDESVLLLDPSCETHRYPGLSTCYHDPMHLYGPPRARARGKDQKPSDQDYEEFYRKLGFCGNSVPLRGFGFSILPLIVAGRTHFIPVMISPIKFPVSPTKNLEIGRAQPSMLAEPGEFLDGVIHIDTFATLGIKTFFTAGDRLNGRLMISTRSPDFEFFPHPETGDIVQRIEVFGTGGDLAKHGITADVESCFTAVFCGPESMYNKVWETSIGERESFIRASHEATIHGIAHAIELVLTCKARCGYPYTRAVIFANSHENIRYLSYWNKDLATAAVLEGQWHHRHHKGLADAWQKCFFLLQQARIKYGFVFEFAVLPPERVKALGLMMSEFWEQETNPRAMQLLTPDRFVAAEDVGEAVANVSITTALNPRGLSSEVLQPSGRVITRNDVMDLLPDGFLVKLPGGEPQDPHLQRPLFDVHLPPSRMKRKEPAEPDSPSSATDSPDPQLFTPHKSPKLYRNDSPTKPGTLQVHHDESPTDQGKGESAYASFVNSGGPEDALMLQTDEPPTDDTKDAPAAGELLGDDTMIKNVKATLDGDDDSRMSDFSGAATPAPSRPRSVSPFDMGVLPDAQLPAQFTRSGTVSPSEYNGPTTPRDYLRQDDLTTRLQVKMFGEEKTDGDTSETTGGEEMCDVDPPARMSFQDENQNLIDSPAAPAPRWCLRSHTKNVSMGKEEKTDNVDGKDVCRTGRILNRRGSHSSMVREVFK